MTKIGLEHILDVIRNRAIYPPELPADKLADWLNGYIACLEYVNFVIEPYIEDEHEEEPNYKNRA